MPGVLKWPVSFATRVRSLSMISRVYQRREVRYLPTIIAAAGGSLPSTRREFSTSGKVGKILICIAGFKNIDIAKTEMKEVFAAAPSSFD